MGTVERKKELQRSSNIKVLTAFGTGFGGFMLVSSGGNAPAAGFLGLALLLVAVVAWYWGLGQYCMSKGYSGLLALAGILGLLGLILLLVLPDKFQVAPPAMAEGPYPRPAGQTTQII